MSSTGKQIRFLGLFLGALLCAGGVFGWVQINPRDVTGDDVGLRLTGNSITFRIEQDGSFDISDSSDITAIRNSYANIDVIPTSDATVVEGAPFDLAPPVDVMDGISGSDGVNRIFFFETDGDGIFDDDTLAAAFIFFNAASGQITDCDIAFNDAGVDWSTFAPDDPGQILPAEEFDIESAANQEIMHCFGIDHSPIAGRFDPATGLQVDGGLSGDFSLQSSVFPLIPLTIEGRSFEEDDIAAFSSLYFECGHERRVWKHFRDGPALGRERNQGRSCGRRSERRPHAPHRRSIVGHRLLPARGRIRDLGTLAGELSGPD